MLHKNAAYLYMAFNNIKSLGLCQYRMYQYARKKNTHKNRNNKNGKNE